MQELVHIVVLVFISVPLCKLQMHVWRVWFFQLTIWHNSYNARSGLTYQSYSPGPVLLSRTSLILQDQSYSPGPVLLSRTSLTLQNQSYSPEPVLLSRTSLTLQDQSYSPGPVLLSRTSLTLQNQSYSPEPVLLSRTSLTLQNQSYSPEPVLLSTLSLIRQNFWPRNFHSMNGVVTVGVYIYRCAPKLKHSSRNTNILLIWFDTFFKIVDGKP